MCDKQKLRYETHIKHDEALRQRKKIHSFLYAQNLKHKAQVTIKTTSKFEEYGITFDDATQQYISTKLLPQNQPNMTPTQ